MSSCECNQDPCCCQYAEIDPCALVNPNPACGSMCNLDTHDNCWYVCEQVGYLSQCRLDQMTYGEVIEVLERYPFAARDLMRITSDPALLELARTVHLRAPQQEDDAVAENLINKTNTLPFYTIFRGNL
jgi:hypothetical protein